MANQKYYTLLERINDPVKGWTTKQLSSQRFASLETMALFVLSVLGYKLSKSLLEIECARFAKFFETEYVALIDGRIFIVDDEEVDTTDAYKEFASTIRDYPEVVLRDCLMIMEQHPNNYDHKYITLIKKYLDAKPSIILIGEA
jgi:hypothetical protein